MGSRTLNVILLVAAVCSLAGSVLLLVDGSVFSGLVDLACTALVVVVVVRAALQRRRDVEAIARRELS